MKTYCDSNAGSQIEPVLWNARESIWITSPWLGKDYAERLASLSRKGIEVRIITSYVDHNFESIKILRAAKNANLRLLILNKEKAAFIHAKIYVVDGKYGVSGSANFTYSGLNSNIENLSIAETEEEVQRIRSNFMNLWMTCDRKSIPEEELCFGIFQSIRDALPLSVSFVDIDRLDVKDRVLAYHPYYFFEFSFRVTVGRSPPVLFEDSGFIVLDGTTRQIINDDLLAEEIRNNPIRDYVVKTENKYRLLVHQRKLESFREARELVLNHIIEKNTRHYRQYYRNRTYDRIFVPFRNIVSFTRSGFVQVPLWYYETFESERRHYQNVVFGASGRKWGEYIYCPECQKKIWSDNAVSCEKCGVKLCDDCIHEKGLIFKKKLCASCLLQSPH